MKPILSFSLPFLLAGVLLSCGTEEAMPDPYDINYVYVQQSLAYSHQILHKEGGEFVQPIVPSEKLVRVRCTKPAPADITVTFAPDLSYVEAWNAEHKTDYKLLSKVKINTLTIKKGEYVSADSLQVTYEDPTEFLDGERFMLPLSISGIEGDGVSPSKKFKTAVVTYRSIRMYFQLQDFKAEVGRRIGDIGDWKVFVNGSETNRYGQKYISVLTDNSSYSEVSYEDAVTLDIDMQEERRIASFAINASAMDRAPKIVGVQKIGAVGEDAEVLADLGEVSLPEDIFKDAVEGFTVHTDVHVNFFKPVEARYLRLTLKGSFADDAWWDPGFNELWFYEE